MESIPSLGADLRRLGEELLTELELLRQKAKGGFPFFPRTSAGVGPQAYLRELGEAKKGRAGASHPPSPSS
jgi:hypothetical protein